MQNYSYYWKMALDVSQFAYADFCDSTHSATLFRKYPHLQIAMFIIKFPFNYFHFSTFAICKINSNHGLRQNHNLPRNSNPRTESNHFPTTLKANPNAEASAVCAAVQKSWQRFKEDGEEGGKKREKGKVQAADRGSRLHRGQKASHGFRGSAGLKGITLSWSVWAWEHGTQPGGSGADAPVAPATYLLHFLLHPLPRCLFNAKTPLSFHPTPGRTPLVWHQLCAALYGVQQRRGCRKRCFCKKRAGRGGWSRLLDGCL